MNSDTAIRAGLGTVLLVVFSWVWEFLRQGPEGACRLPAQ